MSDCGIEAKEKKERQHQASLRHGSPKLTSPQLAWAFLSFNDEGPRETAWLVTLFLDAESRPHWSITTSRFLVFYHRNRHWNDHLQSYHLTVANGVAGWPLSVSAQSPGLARYSQPSPWPHD